MSGEEVSSLIDDPNFCLEIRRFYTFTHISACAASVLLNVLLMYTARWSKNTMMKSYGRMIQLNAFADIYISLVGIVSGSSAIPAYQNLFLINEGPISRALSETSNQIISVIDMGAFFLICVMTPMQFVVRYRIISNSSSVDGNRLIPAFVILFVGVHLQAFLFCRFGTIWGGEEMTALLQQTAFFKFDLPYFSVVDQNSQLLKLSSLVQLVENGTIIYCGIRIYFCLKRQRHIMSQRTIRLNRQLNWILAFQAFYPLLMCGLPTSVSFALMQRRISLPWLSIFENIVVPTMPAANALTVLLVMPCYRRVVLSMFTGRVRADSTNMAPSVSNAPPSLKTTHTRWSFEKF